MLPRSFSELIRSFSETDAPSGPLDTEGLRSEAESAFEKFGGSQTDLADELGMHRTVVSRALRNEGRKYAAPQARIVSHVLGVPVERRSTYRGAEDDHRWFVDP
jgi:hypothetical protein